MQETIIQLRDEIAEVSRHLNAILETIEQGSYGASEAVFDLDNLNLGAITALLHVIAEQGDPR